MKLNSWNEEVVDFDYFNLTTPFRNTHEIALKLSAMLSAFASIDDVICMDTDVTTWNYKTTVGTGSRAIVFRVPTQGIQRMTLASHFASYGLRQYQSCYLSIHEYYCLKDLFDWFNDLEFSGRRRQQLHIENMEILEVVCAEFRRVYSKIVPEFLFEVLKG